MISGLQLNNLFLNTVPTNVGLLDFSKRAMMSGNKQLWGAPGLLISVHR